MELELKNNILVVDDSEMNRSILVDILEQDFQVLEAENGRQALEIIQQQGQAIALVLLDTVMPELDGLQVLEWMKENHWLERMPVVLMCTENNHVYIEKAYELGVSDYICRPFDGCIIRRRVSNMLKLYTKQHRMQELVQDGGRRAGGLTVSDRTLRLLERERTKYQFFASMSREIEFEYDVESGVLTLSEWGADYLGVKELQSRPRKNQVLHQVIDERELGELVSMLHATTSQCPIVEYSCAINVKGERRWGKLICRSLWSAEENGRYIGAIGKFVDTHEEHSRIKALEQMAAQDSLTGLLNHCHVKEQITQRLTQWPLVPYVLAIMDLDHFKQANDCHGHLFGDMVLKHVADRLRRNIRSTDLAARVGGDEFLIFMECAGCVEDQMGRVFEAMSQKYEEFEVTVSMGVAQATVERRNYESLFQCADQALYAAKGAGRACCRIYQDETNC